MALFAASKANVAWLLARLTRRTIGPDKINQWRHVLFLRDEEDRALMDRHRALIAPKFQRVRRCSKSTWRICECQLDEAQGGYSISLTVPTDCARRVVALAKDAGIASRRRRTVSARQGS